MLGSIRDTGSPSPTDLPSTNEAWLDALRGPDRDATAVAGLRALLVRGLRAALRDRVPRRVDALAEDFAQDALVKILDRLETFRGESTFTTWAQKIAVRTAFSELRRKQWEDVSLQDVVGEGTQFSSEAGTAPDRADPEESTSHQLLLDRVQQIIQDTLTDRQRTAITAVMQDMPLQEVARRMDTNRNALYKVIHDARQKVKDTLETQYDLSADQLLAELA
jgi:RNA polymerase sigma-70 factor (ECF subfamily)